MGPLGPSLNTRHKSIHPTNIGPCPNFQTRRPNHDGSCWNDFSVLTTDYPLLLHLMQEPTHNQFPITNGFPCFFHLRSFLFVSFSYSDIGNHSSILSNIRGAYFNISPSSGWVDCRQCHGSLATERLGNSLVQDLIDALQQSRDRLVSCL